MAIAYDATASDNVNATSATFAHVCSGSNRILFVGVGAELGTGDSVTGVTYNSVALTKIDSQAQTGGVSNYWISLWYLVSPTSGSNNVVVSADETINLRCYSVSYQGALQTGQPDSSNKNTLNTTDLSIATTVVSANSWLVSVCQALGVQPVSGSGITSRNTSSNNTNIGDSNAAVSAGSNTIHWTQDPSVAMNGIVASFKPAPEISSGSPAFLLNFV